MTPKIHLFTYYNKKRNKGTMDKDLDYLADLYDRMNPENPENEPEESYIWENDYDDDYDV